MENITETDSGPASSVTHEALLSALSGSASPALTPPVASSTAEPQMGEVGGSDAVEEQATASVESESHEKTATVLRPSPPPTGPTSPRHDNTSEMRSDAEPEEKDFTEERGSLEHAGSDSKDMDLTTTFVDNNLSLETDEKCLSTPALHAQNQNQNLRVDARPPSPQPWDLVEPPHGNNVDATDYYSSLGTKNFGTLQMMRCL